MAIDPARADLINRLYYQELGRVEADPEGLNYWAGRTDLADNELRAALRSAAGLEGESVTAPLLADQGYSAFLRKMQLDESGIQSSLQAAQEAAKRRIQGQAGQYNTQREQQARNTNQGFESRGMFRSGGRLGELARGRGQIDYQQRQFEDAQQSNIAGMETDAASRIAALRRQRAEQELSTRDRLTQRSVSPAAAAV